MSVESEAAISQRLGPGERLIWSGQPKGGLRLRPADGLMIPFSLMWGGFAIFWEISVVRTNAPLLFRVWGVPFVFAGLYVIFGRFFADAYRRKRTVYGLTDQRVLVLGGLAGRQLTSLPLRSLADFSLTERGDLSGTITFGNAASPMGWMAGTGWPGMGRYMPLQFEMIEQARSVYEQIRSAQASR